jgi:hypothetical protein
MDRKAQASDKGTKRMAMLRAWRRAADSDSKPTPTPDYRRPIGLVVPDPQSLTEKTKETERVS